VRLNNSADAISDLNDLPIRTVDGATITMRDVAQVHDGSPAQSNVVRVNGRHSVLMSILKAGSTSTITSWNRCATFCRRCRPRCRPN
jgi:multidrug efflux pump subunit AcrB